MSYEALIAKLSEQDIFAALLKEVGQACFDPSEFG